jgi:protein-disulfide isomerase
VVGATRGAVLLRAALALSLALFIGWLAVSKLAKPAAQRASSVPVSQRAAMPAADNPCQALKLRLCREFAETSSACALAARETGGFSAARCESMLGRYAQVALELRQLDAGTRELTAQQQRSLHGEAPLLGPPDAEITLVEFADFQSADCARASPMARIATNLYPGRVRVVFRQYPSSKHPDAHLAAEASLAAHAQGKFWSFHDLLFANPQDLSRAALERYASELGLDLTAFRHDLDTRRFAADVDADVELGHKVQALDRPSVYANGKPVSVPYGVAELSKLVETTLALRAQR